MNTSKIALYSNPGELCKLTPAETIRTMFEHTDENGILFIPAWPSDGLYDDKQYYRLSMNWSREDAEKTVAKCEALSSALRELSKKENALSSSTSPESLTEEQSKVWSDYLCNYLLEKKDLELPEDIEERLQALHDAKRYEEKMKASNDTKEMDKTEKIYYDACKEVNISDSEMKLYDDYKRLLRAEAESRIGKGLVATTVIARARRYCKFLTMHAPDIILIVEGAYLAQAMVIHDHCTKMETVDEVE